MSDSSLYPNDSDAMGVFYPEAPEEQRETEETNKSRMTTSLPILEDLIQWFEDQISEADSTDNIQLDTIEVNGVKYDRKTSIEGQLLAYRLLKQKFQEKGQEFKTFWEAMQ